MIVKIKFYVLKCLLKFICFVFNLECEDRLAIKYYANIDLDGANVEGKVADYNNFKFNIVPKFKMDFETKLYLKVKSGLGNEEEKELYNKLNLNKYDVKVKLENSIEKLNRDIADDCYEIDKLFKEQYKNLNNSIDKLYGDK